MFKFQNIAFVCLFLLFSCSEEQPENSGDTKDSLAVTTPNIVDNDADEHGCKASAGYTYSHIRKDCIRLFESGIRLDPKQADLDSTVSAFVVFADSMATSDAELFLPSLKESIGMAKRSENTWQDTSSAKQYVLKKEGQVYSLSSAEQKEVLYQSE